MGCVEGGYVEGEGVRGGGKGTQRTLGFLLHEFGGGGLPARGLGHCDLGF